MKIALVNPAISGHKFRGTGTYGQELFKALKKIEDIAISQEDYGSDLSGFDAVHYPYFDPFFLTLPVVKTKPTVVTVHDLIPCKFPDFFPKGLKGTVKWWTQKLSLRGAKAVITDSIASQKDIVEFAGIGKGKISVIYLGVRSEFKILKSDDALQKIKKKYKLPEKFLLHVGDVNYNKNIPGVIKVFSKLSSKYNDLFLVLVGNGFVEESSQLQEIKDLILQLGLTDKVKRMGYIDLFDLVGVYNLAQAYLQLSYAEGFGLPVLEAMACGCPTVVANLTSLPELAGNASILVNPYDEEEVVSGVVEALGNKVKREDLIKRGLRRAESFTWEKCARETLKIYQSVISGIH